MISLFPGGFVVKYTPTFPGTYSVAILLNSIHITGSPFSVEALPMPVVSSNIDTVLLSSLNLLTPLSSSPIPPAYLNQSLLNQLEFCSNNVMASTINAYGPGVAAEPSVCFVNHIAEFIVDVKRVLNCHRKVLRGNATGSGQNTTDLKNEIASAQIKVVVDGPCEVNIYCKDNGDGIISCAYLPTLPGQYLVSILYNRQHHILDSPFNVKVVVPPQ